MELIGKLKSGVKEMEALAIDIADKHLEATKQAMSSTKDSEKKMSALQATADKRLEKYWRNTSKQRRRLMS
jgi:hypothetical protein